MIVVTILNVAMSDIEPAEGTPPAAVHAVQPSSPTPVVVFPKVVPPGGRAASSQGNCT